MPQRAKTRRRPSSRRTNSYSYDLKPLADHEKAIIREAMDRLEENDASCARELGIAKSTMYEKLYHYGLRKRD